MIERPGQGKKCSLLLPPPSTARATASPIMHLVLAELSCCSSVSLREDVGRALGGRAATINRSKEK